MSSSFSTRKLLGEPLDGHPKYDKVAGPRLSSPQTLLLPDLRHRVSGSFPRPLLSRMYLKPSGCPFKFQITESSCRGI